MISNARLTPILPVVDVSRGTGFYRDRLGMKDVGDEPGGNHLLRTDSGATLALIGEKAAWFADGEGNILCLHEHVMVTCRADTLRNPL